MEECRKMKERAILAHRALEALKHPREKTLESFTNSQKMFKENMDWIQNVRKEVEALVHKNGIISVLEVEKTLQTLPEVKIEPIKEEEEEVIHEKENPEEDEEDYDEEEEDHEELPVLLPKTPVAKPKSKTKIREESSPMNDDEINRVRQNKRKSKEESGRSSKKLAQSYSTDEEKSPQFKQPKAKSVSDEKLQNSDRKTRSKVRQSNKTEVKKEVIIPDEIENRIPIEKDSPPKTNRKSRRSDVSRSPLCPNDDNSKPVNRTVIKSSKALDSSIDSKSTASSKCSNRGSTTSSNSVKSSNRGSTTSSNSAKSNRESSASSKSGRSNRGSTVSMESRKTVDTDSAVDSQEEEVSEPIKQPPIRRSTRSSVEKRRSNYSEYQALVNKAVRTSNAADKKKLESVDNNQEKYRTPNQTNTLPRTMSASRSIFKSSGTLFRTHSFKCASPYPRNPSTMSSNSRVFLSSKSTSRLITKTGTPSNIVKGLRTFISSSKPTPPSAEELKAKAEEERLKKRRKEDEAAKRKEELAKQRIEEKKLQREARLRKVKENKEILKKQKSDTDLQIKEAAAQRLEAEAKKKKLIEERKLKDEEEKKLIREALDKEKALKKKQEAAKALEEQKIKERLIAAERKRLELLKKNAEKKAKEEEEQARIAKEKQTKLNDLMNQKKAEINSAATNINNVTYVCEEDCPTSSYDMTPAPEDRSPEPLKNQENYDIDDLDSGDETDEDDRPKKDVPKWASGVLFRQAVLDAAYNPPDVDEIFAIPPMPDLKAMFAVMKKRFFKRTSSAVWNKAPLSHKF